MTKKFLKKDIIETTIVEKQQLNRYQAAKELEKRLNYNNAEEILLLAKEYCNNRCVDPSNLNPMITCTYRCEIWKVKNKALSVKLTNNP